MFSEYFKTEFQQNGLVRLKNELTEQGFEILDLSESNPTKCGFDFSFFDDENIFSSKDNFLYNPDSKGSFAVRQYIAEYYRLRYNHTVTNINPENIFLTSGTSESYSHLFKILLNPGDEILIPKPCYPLFELLANINYIDFKYYRLNYKGNWLIDFDSLRSSVTQKSKAIIVVHPNNPTGNYLSSPELLELSAFCSEYDISLICDEVFYDYNLIPLKDKADFINVEFDFPVFILNGLSKITATPQFKLGWILVNSPEKYNKKINDSLEIVCDTYLSVNSIIQNSFGKIFGLRNSIQKPIKQRILGNFNLLLSLFPNMYRIEGGWNAVLKLNPSDDEDSFVENLLRNHKIFVHPGYFYDFDSSPKIVLSLLPEFEIFKKAVSCIQKYL